MVQHQGFIELGMWREACNVLEHLPRELGNDVVVWLAKVDALVGMKDWSAARFLAECVANAQPLRTDAWHRVAQVTAQVGDLAAAREAVAKCVSLDPELRVKLLDDKLLSQIW